MQVQHAQRGLQGHSQPAAPGKLRRQPGVLASVSQQLGQAAAGAVLWEGLDGTEWALVGCGSKGSTASALTRTTLCQCLLLLHLHCTPTHPTRDDAGRCSADSIEGNHVWVPERGQQARLLRQVGRLPRLHSKRTFDRHRSRCRSANNCTTPQQATCSRSAATFQPKLPPTASTRATSGEDCSSSCWASAELLTCSALPASSSLTATGLSCQRPRNTCKDRMVGRAGGRVQGRFFCQLFFFQTLDLPSQSCRPQARPGW